MIEIARGALAAPATDDDAAAARRRRIAEMLRNGEEVRVNQDGTLHEPGRPAPDGPGAGPGAGTGAGAPYTDIHECITRIQLLRGAFEDYLNTHVSG